MRRLNRSHPVRKSASINRGLSQWWLRLPNRNKDNSPLQGLISGRHEATQRGEFVHDAGHKAPGHWGAVLLGGTDQYLSIPAGTTYTPTANFTMCCWVNFVSLRGTSTWWENAFLAQDEGEGQVPKWMFSHDEGANNMVWHIQDIGGGGPVITSDSWHPSEGIWYHVGLTKAWDGVSTYDYTFFLNGRPHGGGSSAYAMPFVDSDLLVGTAEELGMWINGPLNARFDDIRIYRQHTLHEGAMFNVYQDSRSGFRESLNWHGVERLPATVGGNPWYFQQQQAIAAG